MSYMDFGCFSKLFCCCDLDFVDRFNVDSKSDAYNLVLIDRSAAGAGWTQDHNYGGTETHHRSWQNDDVHTRAAGGTRTSSWNYTGYTTRTNSSTSYVPYWYKNENPGRISTASVCCGGGPAEGADYEIAKVSSVNGTSGSSFRVGYDKLNTAEMAVLWSRMSEFGPHFSRDLDFLPGRRFFSRKRKGQFKARIPQEIATFLAQTRRLFAGDIHNSWQRGKSRLRQDPIGFQRIQKHTLRSTRNRGAEGGCGQGPVRGGDLLRDSVRAHGRSDDAVRGVRGASALVLWRRVVGDNGPLFRRLDGHARVDPGRVEWYTKQFLGVHFADNFA